MKARIVVLPGDGIGPEVAAAGVAVLRHVAERFGHHFEFSEHLIGGAAMDVLGDPLPPLIRTSSFTISTGNWYVWFEPSRRGRLAALITTLVP